MKTALENLIVLLKDENTISPYEMCSSGLVQALLTVLNNVSCYVRAKYIALKIICNYPFGRVIFILLCQQITKAE